MRRKDIWTLVVGLATAVGWAVEGLALDAQATSVGTANVKLADKVAPTLLDGAALSVAVTPSLDFNGGRVTLSLPADALDPGTYRASQMAYRLVLRGLPDAVAGVPNADGTEVVFRLASETCTAGNVYRGEIVLDYGDGALTLAPVAVHQGEQAYETLADWVDEAAADGVRASTFGSTGTWSGGISEQDGVLVVDREEGVTFTPDANPDYVARCDSEFEVVLSAAEAIDASKDAPVADDVQGGVRMVKAGATTVKVQYLVGNGWTDGAQAVTAGLDETRTVRVKFHHAKDVSDASTVTYLVGDAVVASGPARNGAAAPVSRVQVADGTRLASLKGVCELDKAVVVDVTIEPSEDIPIDAGSLEAAQRIADGLVVAISDEVAGVVDATAYRGYFKVDVKETAGPDGATGYAANVTFADGVRSEIEAELGTALARVVEGFGSGATSVSFAGRPGLYYGLVRGGSPDALTAEEPRVLAGANGTVSVTVTKPAGGDRQFYRIVCSPVPDTER